MPTPEQIQQIRFIDGVNRSEDARIADPGSWYATENLYGRSMGGLVKRPGSRLVVNGQRGESGGAINPPGDYDLTAGGFLALGQRVPADGTTVPASALANNYFTAFATDHRGTRRLKPKINPIVVMPSTLPTSASKLNLPPQRVAGLARIYMDGANRFWVGALNFEGGYTDKMFYINGTNLNTMPTEQSNGHTIISTSGADFFFLPLRVVDPTDSAFSDARHGYWALATNQVDQPICVCKSPTGTGVSLTTFEANSDGAPDGEDVIVAVQAMTMFAGQVVWGGFRTRDVGSAGVGNQYDNFICFSNPDEPDELAGAAGLVYSFRVGDTTAEPVTALATTAQPMDAVGQHAQLLAFTERRLKVFSGLPPVNGEPAGTDFVSNEFPTGCNSPRSVVRTPAGVVWLGSDGRFYLFAGGEPQVIGAGVESVFKHLTPRQQKQCAAIFDPASGYYKFSYPDTTAERGAMGWTHFGTDRKSGRPEHDIPDRQAWCDMRVLASGQFDLGVRWYLPMLGMKHSCFAIADGAEDRGEVYAGSAVDGSIIEVGLSAYTTDPDPAAPASTKAVKACGITNLFDLGDAHVDKTLTALSYGFGYDRVATFRTSIIVNADNQAVTTQQLFSHSVTPVPDLIGSSFVVGTSDLASPDSFEFFTDRAGDRMRGKTFRFTFEELTGDAPIFFSDIGFRAIVANRRI